MSAVVGFLVLFAFTAAMTLLVPLALLPLAAVAVWVLRRSRREGVAVVEPAKVVRDARPAEPARAGSVRAA